MYRKSNARLLAISPQLPEQSRAVIEKHGLNFEILFDEGNAFANQLDITHGFEDDLKQIYLGFGIDLDSANGPTGWNLPMPCRMIISSDKTIQSIEVNASYTQRPEPADTLSLLTASTS